MKPAQLLSGAFYLIACRQFRLGQPWQTALFCGALTVGSFALPLMSMLLVRRPMVFQIPLGIYLLLNGWILSRVVRRRMSGTTNLQKS